MAVTTSIPIIDISAEGTDQAQVAKELVNAAVEYGFVYIRNAGRDISTEQIENAFNISRILFSSPLEDKQRCTIEKNNQGWSGMHSETLDPKTQRVGDFKEAFNFGPFTDNKATQPIPQSIESHQAQLAAFKDACHDLCRKLLLLFGIGLGVNPPDFFTAAHTSAAAGSPIPSGSILRLLYYPPPSNTPTALSSDVRAGAHSDYGSVTLLFRLRGQAGLELLDPRTETWAPVPVIPPGTETDAQPPILVNIGDLLSYWTNGLLRSTVHRVAFTSTSTNGESVTDPRYSIAYFCHPADDTPLGAVPSSRVATFQPDRANGNSNPYAERKVLTAKEHLQMRLRATYLEMYEGDKKN
ncbi:2OG-Fe(II) oxygenase superfamily protein [Annulohypoxylon maeteangense]|uniref:2OG-Fe(II) oxygenase superfamily protein n=1 Tax=Annulohypoxylon maeteangense TaxID=1927788 RepID=UPI0020074C9E|nr:2OG-Fe(II) oxygenase superfamily protein [Annulohypoxylon maeteangense]KAI0881061.1 2OG-Fe(II) oxygenase superfamily protein [Annulohypoxylon maeteangense]